MGVVRVGLDARRAVQIASRHLAPLATSLQGSDEEASAGFVATGAVVIATTFWWYDCMRRRWLKGQGHGTIKGNPSLHRCHHCGHTKANCWNASRSAHFGPSVICCGVSRTRASSAEIQVKERHADVGSVVPGLCRVDASGWLLFPPPRLLHHALRTCIGLACRCRIGSASRRCRLCWRCWCWRRA